MRVSVLAERAGCHIETVRYYENIGLLKAPERSAGRFRVYAEEDVERLAFVMRCRGLGFSIDETRSLLELTADTCQPCEAVDQFVAQHLADIERRQRELEAMAVTLRGSLAACGRTTVECCSVTGRLRSPEGGAS